MLAKSIQSCHQVFSETNPGKSPADMDLGFLLIGFFKIYGNPNGLNRNTILNIHEAKIDFYNNYMISSCQQLFALCFRVLSKALQSQRCNGSLLSTLINPLVLKKTRDQVIRKCNMSPSLKDSQKNAIASTILQGLNKRLSEESLISKQLNLEDVINTNAALGLRLRSYRSADEALNVKVHMHRAYKPLPKDILSGEKNKSVKQKKKEESVQKSQEKAFGYQTKKKAEKKIRKKTYKKEKLQKRRRPRQLQ